VRGKHTQQELKLP